MTATVGSATRRDAHLTGAQRERIAWLRHELAPLRALPRPGSGGTRVRWRAFMDVARADLAAVRLVEGHADALAIIDELGGRAEPGHAWGVWAAEPGRLRAAPALGGWHLHGHKGWCSGSSGLDRALVTALAPDGPRLFVVDPAQLDVEPGSWAPIGMAASASHTMSGPRRNRRRGRHMSR